MTNPIDRGTVRDNEVGSTISVEVRHRHRVWARPPATRLLAAGTKVPLPLPIRTVTCFVVSVSDHQIQNAIATKVSCLIESGP